MKANSVYVYLLPLAVVAGDGPNSAIDKKQPGDLMKSHAALASEAGAWVVDLDTRGGFTGQGRGGVSINSQGTVIASRNSLISRPHFPCRVQLSGTDFQPITQAVLKAKPSAWKPTYVPAGDNGCCDRHKWTLKLHRREADGIERTHTTFWYDANEGFLPKDLEALRKELVTILNAVLNGCKQ